MPLPLFHCLALEPRYGNTACQGWCRVRHEAAPSQSIPPPHRRVPGELPALGSACSEKGNSATAHGGPGPAGCPPGEAAWHVPAITVERSIHRESIPALLTQTASLRSFHRDAARDLRGAGAKCRAGTKGGFFQFGIPTKGLAGTRGAAFLPCALDQSKRGRRKTQSQSFENSSSPAAPFPRRNQPRVKSWLDPRLPPHTPKSQGEKVNNPQNTLNSLC